MSKPSAHWSKVSESGSIFGMKILLFCYRLFGRGLFRLLLAPVIIYFYFTNKKARHASEEYLSKLKPLLTPEKAAKLTSFRHLWTFGEILLDKFLVWMGDIKHEDVIFETQDAFAEMKQSTKGGIIVLSHLGNTEVCSALAHQLPDIKVTMLVHTLHAEKFNSLLKKTNENASVNLMQITDISPATAMILSERIANGEFVVVAGDRTPINGSGRISNVDFLGAPAPLPQGVFILASLLRCPTYFMFCLKHSDNYHIYLEKVSDDFSCPRKERDNHLSQAIQLYAHRLEYYCQKEPLQWFNFFPFWGENNQTKQIIDVPSSKDIKTSIDT